MPAIMRKKVRSYLKGLAENRARAAADVIRFEVMVAQVTRRLAEAKLDLESCDRLIKKYDPRLQPECIVPIRVWPHPAEHSAHSDIFRSHEYLSTMVGNSA
jgi:hypothetical protein